MWVVTLFYFLLFQSIITQNYIVQVTPEYNGAGDKMEFGSDFILVILTYDQIQGYDSQEHILTIWGDGIMSTAMCQRNAPWHLNAIVQESFPPNTWFNYRSPQMNQIVYILDTWVDIDHYEFEKRVRRGPSFNFGTSNFHGTFVTALVLGKTYGVNKNARGVSVQVLNNQGYGSWSQLLAALNWVNKHSKSIINISISGTFSYPVNTAINLMIKNGWKIVVAAGNNADNACKFTPSASNSIVVGSFNSAGQLSAFSNYGECVSILAPGDVINSAAPQNQTVWASGTSFASPIIAGILSATNWSYNDLINYSSETIIHWRLDTTKKRPLVKYNGRCFNMILQNDIFLEVDLDLNNS